MFEKLKMIAKAGSVVKNQAANVQETLRQSKISAAERGEPDKSKTTVLLEEYWPRLESELVERLLRLTEDKLQDDTSVEEALLVLYNALPFPVRLVLSKDTLLAFTLQKRDSLLGKVQEARMKRACPTPANSVDALPPV